MEQPDQFYFWLQTILTGGIGALFVQFIHWWREVPRREEKRLERQVYDLYGPIWEITFSAQRETFLTEEMEDNIWIFPRQLWAKNQEIERLLIKL